MELIILYIHLTMKSSQEMSRTDKMAQKPGDWFLNVFI